MNGHNSDLPESDLSSASSGIRVLLVDDQAFIGKMLGRMLESEEDIELHHFQSAREALKMADEISPTVILQDLVMPEIDGLNMVHYFRVKKHTQHTPLIVLSAQENPQVKAEAFALGANDYMVKPPDKIELIARIRYHSQAYMNRLQRDDAHRRLEEQTIKLTQTNEQLLEQIAERRRIESALRESKKKVEKEREAAESANKKVMDSIRYAKMIQSSLLPNPDNIKTFLSESFFIWMPRDIVGGDFIFTDIFEQGFIIAVLDCTGHGVPGAFMTMIASFGLKKIISGEGWHDPAQILKRLSFLVKTTLQQDTDYALSDDGLDAAVCFVEPDESRLTFAGAKLPLICNYDGEVKVIKGDRKSIGYKKSSLKFNFTNHTISINKGMSFYMFSDGFVDQLGGQRERRFGTRRLANLIRKNTHLPFDTQRDILIQAFNTWQEYGENERQDDVTVVGFGF
ncbi:SpoIIE family protein phosphatase [Desulfonema magnum]|uniref:Signal transduction response regulator, receiver domain phosphatase PPM-type n=1 Tax=Desulfonema magnum TaxID=45655 RepID=A0A975GMI0_9BACT|nr:SpoIIE family protein phosphatase [Desulfonema magnum]QTA86685.1 Signal transduction response regulator, receiver domain phosphatase PPM-type [Desulfonema magnum]